MKRFILISILSVIVFTVSAQSKIVIDDRSSIINEQVENLLKEKFQDKNLELTSSVDFKTKCDYYFATISQNNRGFVIKVEDCENTILGSLFAGSHLNEAGDQEKAVILFYNISDIIENPSYSDSYSKTDDETAEAVHPDSIESEHDSRYFFAPSALPLKKRELYYNSIYFLVHDIQYGVTDRLTIGMGTTIIGLPIYFTGKLSIPINENSHLAVGDLLMLGTYGTEFFGNLAFATYTYGNRNSNISLGGGYLYFNPGEFTQTTSSAVGNISGIVKAGKYFYFLTENYITNFNDTEDAYRETILANGDFNFENAEFTMKRSVWYGLSGIRFVRKGNELVSWQFGITHILMVNSSIPAPYNGNGWQTYTDDQRARMIAFPTLSFTRKFKL